MNKFKSKTNISDYVIRMKLKRGTVFPVSECLMCLLLNERIQIENEYSWLCNLYESEGTVFPVSELIICSHLRANALT